MDVYKKIIKKFVILFFYFFNLNSFIDENKSNFFCFCNLNNNFSIFENINLNVDIESYPNVSPMKKINIIVGDLIYLNNKNYLNINFEKLSGIENGVLSINGKNNSPILNQDYEEFFLNLKQCVFDLKLNKNIVVNAINIDFSTLEDDFFKDEDNELKLWLKNFLLKIKNDENDENEINLKNIKLIISFNSLFDSLNKVFSENIKKFILDLNEITNEESDKYKNIFDFINIINFDFFDKDYSLLDSDGKIYFLNSFFKYLYHENYKDVQSVFNPKLFCFTFKLNFKNSDQFEKFQRVIEFLNGHGFTNFGILNFNEFYLKDFVYDLKNLELITKTLYIN